MHYFAFYRKLIWKTCAGTAFLPCLLAMWAVAFHIVPAVAIGRLQKQH